MPVILPLLMFMQAYDPEIEAVMVRKLNEQMEGRRNG